MINMSDILCIADKVEKLIERNETTENPEQLDCVFWLKPKSIPINTANDPHSRLDRSFPIWPEEREWGQELVVTGKYQISGMRVEDILSPVTEDAIQDERGIIYPYMPRSTAGMQMLLIGNNVLVDYSLPFLKLSFGKVGLPSALEQRLEQFQQLTEGWDSYGSEAISHAAVERSIILLQDLYAYFKELGKTLPEPFVAPIPDGRIQIEWSGDEKEVEVTVDEKGIIEYLLFSSDDVWNYKTDSVSTARGLGELLQTEVFKKSNEP